MNLDQRKRRKQLAATLRGKRLQDLTPKQRQEIKRKWHQE